MATKVRRIEWITVVGLSTFLFATWAEAGEVEYQKPPQTVLDVFNAPPFPVALSNPTGDTLLLVRPVLYPPMGQLAKPMLRLADLRIDPTTNGEHNSLYWSDLSLRKIADSSEVKIDKESRAREFRVQGSNVFNTAHFTSINTFVGSLPYGQVTSAGDMRRLTLLARFRF